MSDDNRELVIAEDVAEKKAAERKASDAKMGIWKKLLLVIGSLLLLGILVVYSIWFFTPYTIYPVDYACYDNLRTYRAMIILYELECLEKEPVDAPYIGGDTEEDHYRNIAIAAYKIGAVPTMDDLYPRYIKTLPKDLEDERGGSYHLQTDIISDSGVTYADVHLVCSLHGSMENFKNPVPEVHRRWEDVKPEQGYHEGVAGGLNILVFFSLIFMNIGYWVFIWRKRPQAKRKAACT
jgi:hypothetical protein